MVPLEDRLEIPFLEIYLFFFSFEMLELWECVDEKTLPPSKLTAKQFAPKNGWKLQVFGISKRSMGSKIFIFRGENGENVSFREGKVNVSPRMCRSSKDEKAWISSAERWHLHQDLASIVEVRQTNILLGRLFPLAEGFFGEMPSRSIIVLTLRLHGMSWGVKTTCLKAPGVSWTEGLVFP